MSSTIHCATALRRLMVVIAAALAYVLMAASLCFAPAAHAAEDFLDPEVAFKFSSRMLDDKTIDVTYTIADGYYMYREQFRFSAQGATLGEPVIPAGKVKFDETFRKEVETYRKSVTISIPVQATGPFTLVATSQGCSDKGLCYVPMDSEARLSPSGGGLLASASDFLQRASAGETRAPAAPVSNVNSVQAGTSSTAIGTGAAVAANDSEMGRIEASLKSGRLIAIIPLFILLGLGLAFTPCVLPMVPILATIIVGDGSKVSRGRALGLAATYSLGMAIVYTALGVAAGLIGEGLSAALQNPWVLTAFALLIAFFALSLFGYYQLQVPASVQTRLMRVSGNHSTGRLTGVFIMGAVSALIVGPCVAAPLAGALVYISQTRDVVVGGSALFAMAVGMSVPLLLVGVSAGSLLPRAGAWMEEIKRFFGVLMLALAVWMISPVIPAWAQMLGWALLGIGYGGYLIWSPQGRWQGRALGLVFATLGILQLTGVATGGRDALTPLAHLSGEHQKAVEFTRVRSVEELDAALLQSKGKNVMLDFYADWCVSCKEMEKLTFSDARIRAQFEAMVLLQVDVTANDANDKALLKRFRLFGPPGIIFFDRQGHELTDKRVIGYQNAENFLKSLSLATQS